MKRSRLSKIVRCTAYILALAAMNTVTVAVLGQTKPMKKCLPYEPAEVSLIGKLVRKTFPGPPEYESIRKGDKPEIFWLIQLRGPLCTNEDAENPELNPAYDDVREVQLVVVPAQYRRYKNLVGQEVEATGTLFGEHTIHHRTAVLLTVKDIQKLPPH